MTNKRLIPCLYLESGRAVTGFGQRNLFGDGDVEALAGFYSDNGADELLVFDFSSGMRSMKRPLPGFGRSAPSQKYRLWQQVILTEWKM